MINRAKKYVYIYTPYLIVDNEMTVALENAAKCGVDVRIVTPGIPDKKLIFLLTQSYYEQLILNGVKIYQYTPGFLHGKCFVCDDKIATVGTINLDYRSLYLHFECGVFMYRSQAVMELKQDVLDTIAGSKQITLDFCRNRNIFIKLLQSDFAVICTAFIKDGMPESFSFSGIHCSKVTVLYLRKIKTENHFAYNQQIPPESYLFLQ